MFLIRVSSKPEYGSGHIYRCISLSKILGFDNVRFILDEGTVYWKNYLKSIGIVCISYNEVKLYRFKAIIYDPYKGVFSELAQLLKISKLICVIADHLNVPADVKLFINYGSNPNINLEKKSNLLIGPKYALVDSKFKKYKIANLNKNIENIIISFGSYDLNNMTSLAIKSLFQIYNSTTNKPKITITMGSRAPHLSQIKKMTDNSLLKCDLLIDNQEIEKVYSKMDLAIGAGGLSLFERFNIGLPSLSLITNDLQRESIDYSEKQNSTIKVGTYKDISVSKISSHLYKIINDYNLRFELSKNAKILVDGEGVTRVVNKIYSMI